jgi:hypothetical protein
MQEPTEDTEASISMENVREGPNLNRAFTGAAMLQTAPFLGT